MENERGLFHVLLFNAVIQFMVYVFGKMRIFCLDYYFYDIIAMLLLLLLHL